MLATTNKKVLLALSGGVDSSVAAHLLRESGYYVEACCIDFSPAHKKTVEAAKAVANMLDMKLHIIECHDLFFKNVIAPFAKAYQSGITPNPCIMCNPTTKFALLEQKANELGFDYISTGHYADIEHTDDGKHFIKKAGFIPRDQSYMLYRLTQSQLSKLILPLHSLPKDEVRSIAQKIDLPSANSPDSQEICFIPSNDYPAYIEEHFGASKKGNFISPDGKVCGEHKGILHYTVGKRKGLGVALGYPVFIKYIDPENGNIYLATRGEELTSKIELSDCVLFPHPLVSEKFRAEVKIRSAASPVSCDVTVNPNGDISLILDEAKGAVAPGQSCVLYSGEYVLGGGYIKPNKM